MWLLSWRLGPSCGDVIEALSMNNIHLSRKKEKGPNSVLWLWRSLFNPTPCVSGVEGFTFGLSFRKVCLCVCMEDKRLFVCFHLHSHLLVVFLTSTTGCCSLCSPAAEKSEPCTSEWEEGILILPGNETKLHAEIKHFSSLNNWSISHLGQK